MKIDIENILYIIVIIIWVVVGLVKKNKKKEGRPAPSGPPVDETQPPDISEMLEELLGKKRSELPKKKPVTAQRKQPRREKVKEPQTLETITGTDFGQRSIKKSELYRERKPVVTRKIKPEDEISQEQESPADIKKIMDESAFDLRKAVIYSEILNPPYQ